jgi:hypothetical protein
MTPMNEPRPAARRRRPAVDPRLVIGIALVVVSVAGVMGIVGAVDRRVTVYAAATTLTPGDRLSTDDLIARQVAVDGPDGLYLDAGDLDDGSLVVTTVVHRDELVPRSAVGDDEGDRSTTLVLPIAGGVSGSVTAGATVDIWSSAEVAPDADEIAAGAFGPPVVLSDEAIVIRVIESEGFVSAGEGVSVEVLIPRSRVARLLQAIANGDALAIVPAGIPLSSR